MESKQAIQTGLRVSEALNEEVERAAAEYEVSKNALMKMALRIGLSALKDVNQTRQPQG